MLDTKAILGKLAHEQDRLYIGHFNGVVWKMMFKCVIIVRDCCPLMDVLADV